MGTPVTDWRTIHTSTQAITNSAVLMLVEESFFIIPLIECWWYELELIGLMG